MLTLAITRADGVWTSVPVVHMLATRERAVGFVGHTFREIGHPGEASSGVGHTGVRGNRQVELLGPRSRVHVDVSAYEFDFVAHTERAAAEERLADLVPEFLAEGPSHHLAWVDLLS